MPTKHLRFGGSTMARTMGCPAWRLKADKLPQQGSSSFADEGTMLHDCMEMMYTPSKGININNILSDKSAIRITKCGEEYLTPELWEEKLIPAHECVEMLFKLYKVDEWYCEPFVELIPDEAGGSIDLVAFGTDPMTGKKIALVIDYKFGFVQVEAEDNIQLLFYALCSAVDPALSEQFAECDGFVTAIVQPNGQGSDLSYHAYPMEVLDDFEMDVYDAIDDAAEPGLPPCAGPWCSYCPAITTCEAKTGAADAALCLDPEDAATLSEAMSMVGPLEAWLKTVKAQTHEQLEMGVNVEGWKLVDKRATRKWLGGDEAQAKIEKMLKGNKKLKVSEVITKKIISPAQFEKLAKKKGVDYEKYAGYIESVSTGTTVAPADDPRDSALPVEALKRLTDRL